MECWRWKHTWGCEISVAYFEYLMGFQKHLANNGGSLCESEMKNVLSVQIDQTQSLMMITTSDELEIGVPIQIQFEVVPDAPIGYAINEPVSGPEYVGERTYTAGIVSVVSSA